MLWQASCNRGKEWKKYDKVSAVIREQSDVPLKILPVQFSPSPVNPGLHVQLKDPWVLLQNASELQLCVSATHSLISEISFQSHVNN